MSGALSVLGDELESADTITGLCQAKRGPPVGSAQAQAI